MQKKLPWFMASAPSEACAKGGAGAYTDLIQMDAGDPTGVAGLTGGRIAASAFRSAYVPLSSQGDFIGGLRVRGLSLLRQNQQREIPCASAPVERCRANDSWPERGTRDEVADIYLAAVLSPVLRLPAFVRPAPLKRPV